MYDDEDWKEDLRNKKKGSDDEKARNQKSGRKLSFLTLLIVAVIGIFKG